MLIRSEEMFEYDETMIRKPIYQSKDICCWLSEEQFNNLNKSLKSVNDFINCYN